MSRAWKMVAVTLGFLCLVLLPTSPVEAQSGCTFGAPWAAGDGYVCQYYYCPGIGEGLTCGYVGGGYPGGGGYFPYPPTPPVPPIWPDCSPGTHPEVDPNDPNSITCWSDPTKFNRRWDNPPGPARAELPNRWARLVIRRADHRAGNSRPVSAAARKPGNADANTGAAVSTFPSDPRRGGSRCRHPHPPFSSWAAVASTSTESIHSPAIWPARDHRYRCGVLSPC